MKSQKVIDGISALTESARPMSIPERVAVYNGALKALGGLVSDVSPDPVLSVQLVHSGALHANDYNPNSVASPEMDLLEDSIRADGVTMPVVTVHDGNGSWIVVDGFHRQSVIRTRLGREYIPCSVINSGMADRIASTIRHNRARGKHQVDLMGGIVRQLIELEWDDDRISQHLGMTNDELLRLKQTVGAATLLAGSEYSKSWGVIEEDRVDEAPGEPCA